MTSQKSDTNGGRVSRETQARLTHFATLFKKWATSINLVAPSTVNDIWRRHIEDSLQISDLNPGPKTWVDLGSGGGFPGIITAIVLAEIGGGWVHLVESNQKKAAFLRVALQETSARGTVHAIRIEQAPLIIPHCDAISARALASLPQLLDYIEPWALVRPELRAFLHKGRDYEAELHKARGRFRFDLVKHPSRIETDSVVLEISDLTRSNDPGAMHDPR